MNKFIFLKSYMHAYIYCSIIYNSQDMEATQVSLDLKNSHDLEVESYILFGGNF